jgi:hypothetical protein
MRFALWGLVLAAVVFIPAVGTSSSSHSSSSCRSAVWSCGDGVTGADGDVLSEVRVVSTGSYRS